MHLGLTASRRGGGRGGGGGPRAGPQSHADVALPRRLAAWSQPAAPRGYRPGVSAAPGEGPLLSLPGARECTRRNGPERKRPSMRRGMCCCLPGPPGRPGDAHAVATVTRFFFVFVFVPGCYLRLLTAANVTGNCRASRRRAAVQTGQVRPGQVARVAHAPPRSATHLWSRETREEEFKAKGGNVPLAVILRGIFSVARRSLLFFFTCMLFLPHITVTCSLLGVKMFSFFFLVEFDGPSAESGSAARRCQVARKVGITPYAVIVSSGPNRPRPWPQSGRLGKSLIFNFR